MSKFSVLFLVNRNKDLDLSFSKEVVSFLLSHDVKVYCEEPISLEIDNTSSFNNEKIDFAIVIGGDGTVLHFAHKYQELDFPFFGINLGRVGCILDSTKEEYKEKLLKLFDGKYYIEGRNVISCEIYSHDELVNKTLAFNEVSLHRASLYKMLLINMLINDRNKTSFYADGLIAATSTGSSAYNLSCGGPLLLPSAKNFVITPVAPQLRIITSLIVNDTDSITISIENKFDQDDFISHRPAVFIDGAYRIELEIDSKLVITKSNKTLKIIKIENNNSLFEPIFKVSLSSSELFTKKDN